jgi:N,N-dimethylformamidase beta subunit-like protein/uncharacterized protein DUF4082/Big-like domain-containing protein
MSSRLVSGFVRLFAVAAALFLFVTTESSRVAMHAQSSCGASINPIACENQKPGNLASEWDVSGAGDGSIQGFATSISVVPGEAVQFKIDTPSSNYRLDIYRMGYYGGMGARKVSDPAGIVPSAALPQVQPPCLTDSSGLIDCGNWDISASWVVPVDAVSGIYFAKLRRIDTGGASHVFFIVREANDAAHKSDLLFQTSDTTWQAYNNYGGKSLYEGGPGTNPGRAYKVSYNRPFATRSVAGGQDWAFNSEYPMVRFLEANGYDVSYTTGVDSDRNGALILNHKVFLSVGHDEYWSGGQRLNVEAARAAGVSLAFFSGNEIYWKTRWADSIDGSGTPYRTLVSYKETHANAKIDPAGATMWTGTWRDPRFSPPADARPENSLTGQLFMVNDGNTSAITVPAANGKARFWRNTTVATLAAGATATMPNGTLGYEWDADVDNGLRPTGLIALSSTTRAVNGMLLDYGSTFGPGTVTHRLSLYRHSSGALVFGAGTVQWTWGLDASHDRGSLPADVRMQQATVNLFADMGAQPGTLQVQDGLVPASASTDVAPPVSTITSPANGASIVAGTPITISGTATDSGGGLVSGVEVSADGGATWAAATGTSPWSFSWTVSGTGTVSIKSRAYDDSGNMETPSAGVSITIASSPACPCSIWSAAAVPPAPLDDNDPASIELGTKFKSDSDGFVAGVRFYKIAANSGIHTGTLWTSTGTQLATVTFSGETASGWQQANFANPVAITANTVYVISYHAPNGHYTGSDSFFASAGVDNPPLHALKNGTSGANGLYRYATGTVFPNSTYLSENYWVDVVFTTTPGADTTPPTVASRVPAAGAVDIDPLAPVSATFNEAMSAASISASSFELRNPQGIAVSAAVTYNATTRTATLFPQSSLASSTTYTVVVKGGAVDPRVKDAAGNAMAANSTWTFTTVAAPPPTCPCSIWLSTAVPAIVDSEDPSSVVLGTRFRSDIAGYVSGARFYKGAMNTGTHVAKLWSNTGTQLATATFANETASGWQEVLFTTPVAIAANTTYVTTYLAPNGHYSNQDSYFAVAGLDTPPLHALQDGIDGANGVYAYSSTNVFPTQTYLSAGYFVDPIFTTATGPDLTPPVVQSTNPFAGASGVSTTTSALVTFNEPVNQTTVTAANVFLKTPTDTVVPATVTYDGTTNTATIAPTAALAYSTVYTGVAKAAVKDVAGNLMGTDFTWTFTSAAPPPPPPTQGPGGPVLVVTRSANPFSTYYAEILRGEGLNAFATADLTAVTSTMLASYDVVILAEAPLTAAQVTMLTTWVTDGGNLIAMRPDKKLAGLLGMTDATTTLADAYLLVNTASSPGAGIVNQTMQFHGVADRYTLSGATAVATLYSNATTATVNPAVTIRKVGLGNAAAFTYDLAKSVIYTRQGNPAWSGQDRDGTLPIRSDDLFFGAKTGNVLPDWVDLNKVAIPQADEQQRLLYNVVLKTNRAKKPLPRFWYFPRMLPAVVIMTGDDHANGGTVGRFNDYLAASTPGCSVNDWQCIRGTSYIYPGTPMTDAEVGSYVAQGFEIALHVTTGCVDWTSASLTSAYTTQLTQFATQYPHAGAPKTNRTHCVVTSDYTTQPQVELNKGIRLDTNYYYFPDTWILDRPGMFTGSGMPQRFASSTGAMIDVYQATTQMTDESGLAFPKHPDALLDNAINLGYYGAFTANMHTDFNPSNSSISSVAIVNSAKNRGIPVISARQMLDWLDGRNASTFQSIAWSGNVLSFTIGVGAGANGLQALVPPAGKGFGPVDSITLNGAPVPFTLQTIKGVSYAVFAAAAGAYEVTYPVLPTYSVVGAIEPAANGSGATVIVTGGGETASTTADLSGNYVFTKVLDGDYTVTAAKSGVSFAPASQVVPVSGASATAATIAATPVTISGAITPAALASGATLTLTGGATATADANGEFSFSGVADGTYTMTPAKSGFIFTPLSLQVTVANATSVSNVAFTVAVAPSVISIDATNTVGRSTRSTSLASGTFNTTAPNELLLAFFSLDNITATPPSTVTAVTGGGLTWTLVGRTNAQRGDAEIWRAFAPTPLTAARVTGTLSQGVAGQITVMSFKGVDPSGTGGSGAIGAIASANALSGAPSASLVTTRDKSLVVGVGSDWDGQTARVLGPGQTLVSQYFATDGDTFWVQRTTDAVPTAGTTVTINDTAPANHRYNLTIVEILLNP